MGVLYIYPIYRPPGLLLGSCPGGSWPSCEHRTFGERAAHRQDPAPALRRQGRVPLWPDSILFVLRGAVSARCPPHAAPAARAYRPEPAVVRGGGGSRRTGDLARSCVHLDRPSWPSSLCPRVGTRCASPSALKPGVVGGQAGDSLDRAARPVRRPGGGRGGEARRIVAHLVEVARIN